MPSTEVFMEGTLQHWHTWPKHLSPWPKHLSPIPLSAAAKHKGSHTQAHEWSRVPIIHFTMQLPITSYIIMTLPSMLPAICFQLWWLQMSSHELVPHAGCTSDYSTLWAPPKLSTMSIQDRQSKEDEYQAYKQLCGDEILWNEMITENNVFLSAAEEITHLIKSKNSVPKAIYQSKSFKYPENQNN